MANPNPLIRLITKLLYHENGTKGYDSIKSYYSLTRNNAHLHNDIIVQLIFFIVLARHEKV